MADSSKYSPKKAKHGGGGFGVHGSLLKLRQADGHHRLHRGAPAEHVLTAHGLPRPGLENKKTRAAKTKQKMAPPTFFLRNLHFCRSSDGPNPAFGLKPPWNMHPSSWEPCRVSAVGVALQSPRSSGAPDFSSLRGWALEV